MMIPTLSFLIGYQIVSQHGVEFELGCSEIDSPSILKVDFGITSIDLARL